LHHENAAISLFHKISNEVAKNLNGRILPLKMKVCWPLLAYQPSKLGRKAEGDLTISVSQYEEAAFSLYAQLHLRN
jgi:hypothetical protein